MIHIHFEGNWSKVMVKATFNYVAVGISPACDVCVRVCVCVCGGGGVVDLAICFMLACNNMYMHSSV